MGPEQRDNLSLDSLSHGGSDDGSSSNASTSKKQQRQQPIANGLSGSGSNGTTTNNAVTVQEQREFSGVEALPEFKLANMTLIMTKSIENGFYRSEFI